MSNHDRTPREPLLTPAGGIPRRNPAPSEAQLLARILEVVPGGIVQLSADGVMLRANEQAQRFLGLAWDAASSRFVNAFSGETFREDGSACPKDEYPVMRCLATGEPAGPTTIGVRQRSGDVRWASFTALPLPEPGSDRLGAVVTFVDITDRRRAEVHARAQDRLLDTVRMVHFRDDPGATVAVFHEPLSSLLELTHSAMGFIASVDPADDPPEELRVHAWIAPTGVRAGSSHPPAPIDDLTRKVLTSGKPRIVEAPGRVGGPFHRYVPRVVAMLPLVTAGKVVGVVGLADAPSGYALEDLAELEPLLAACADLVAAFDERRARRDLTAQLAQAERLASVGTLAAGMAHEINNPLAYVLLNLQAFTRHTEALGAAHARLTDRLEAALGHEQARVLLTDVGLADVSARLARVVQHGKDATEGAERVQRIVRDLMTFSRVTEEQQTLVDVNAAVEVALKMAHHEIKYRARLVRELGELAPVLGNDGRLSQVFLNLFINAARAIEEGHPDENEIRVRTWLADGEISVEVADTGQGVAPEHLERLFEPFFSTRAPGAGAGLGLSICHNVVRAHGGRIEVESEIGRGTRFLVRLPASEARLPAEKASPTTASTPPTRRWRILLVDDEPMVLRVLAQLLGRTYDVVSADGYTSATNTLARDDRFDVILCDMMMLDGTGVDVHAWVNEHRPSLAPRMVFITGGTFTPKARTFLSEVAAHHLVKPFSLRELDQVLANLLGR